VPNGVWTPWKLAAIGVALVAVTALVTGIVVAHWNTATPDPAREPAGGEIASGSRTTSPPATAKPGSGAVTRATPAPGPRLAVAPSAADIEACNQYAKSQTDKTTETIKDALIGGAVGAGVGAAGGAVAGGGKAAGKGAAIGGLVGATAGTLFGLNEGRQADSRYVEAYRGCMRSRGYIG
jgi:hypothetical protein